MARLTFDRTVWLRHTRNVAIGFVILMVVIGVVGFFIAPGIVKDIAEKQITEQTGRKATIASLKLNPYVLSATIAGLKLYQPDGSTIAVEVDEIFADISSASLFRRALVFDALRVTRPKISIARLEAQRFDFSDIVDKILAKPKSDSTVHFSLNNIELDDGRIAFDDRVTGRKHVIEHIALGLPFVSDLPYYTDIFVTPKFGAIVNGSAIALEGKAQPFSKDREASIEFDITDLDVPTYLDFAPTALRFKVASAKLSTKIAIAFKAAAQTADGKTTPQSLAISGHVGIADLRIADLAAHEVIAIKRIDVDADKVEPLLSAIALKRVAIIDPHIAAIRHKDDSIDLVALFASPQSTKVAPASEAKAPASNGPKPSVSIAAASIEGGSISLTDETLATPATTTFDAIDLKVDRIALQGDAPTDFALSLHTPDEGIIETKGNAVIAQSKATGTFQMRHFRPGAFANYLATFLAARIGDGTVDVDAKYDIDASRPALLGKVEAISARITKLRSQLPNEKTSFVAADAIALEGASYDFPTHAFAADSLTLTAPVIAIVRDAKGRLNLQTAMIEKAPTHPQTPTQAPHEKDVAIVVKPADTKPFTALIKSFAIERGDVSFEDESQGTPVHVHASPLNFKADNVGTLAGSVVPFTLDTGVEKRGKLAVKGKVSASPLSVDATVNASNVAVGWLAVYAGDRLNIVLENADLNARGTVRMLPSPTRRADAPPTLSYRGSLGIARLRALDKISSEEFVQWKALDIPQVEFDMPAKNAPMSVSLGTIALDDFYARIIVNTTGRLNLQDVVATPGQQQSVTKPEGEGGPAPAPTPASVVTQKKNESSAQIAAPTPAATGPQPLMRIKGIKLNNGRIGITDNFVKPNYSANLTDLVGEVSAIASDAPQPADVKLDGKIDGDGVLTVAGKLNPFAFTTYTDIAAEAKDIELTRLSPYAIKYAGYAIERGKLSMTVKYHIDQGKLEASNRLFLDQLTFGQKVDSPTATKLPVLLAISLLKNSRGEIDVNLPISGTLSDPEFSIGGVIIRVIINLLTRAITSPFSLIASAIGGGGSSDELGYVQFKPGVSDMTPQGKAKLETLAKALADRPALKLDIIGRFDPATDPEGIKRDHLLDRLKDLKAKDQSKSGERVGRNDVTIEDNEYATYLAKVYDDTKLPDKPRNAIGLAKTIPTEEMEKLLLANMKLDDNDPRWLAEARADVVRHYIEDTGKVSPSRVFLVTPKLNADGIKDKGAPNRVDFELR
jgi:Domain of Unknown Function (DUF748)